MKSNILLVGASAREEREIHAAGIAQHFDVCFHHRDATFYEQRFYQDDAAANAFDINADVALVLEELRRNPPDGVISALDHPGSALAAVYARELGLPGPNPEEVIRVQNKFEARLHQQRLIPEAVPDFALVRAADAGRGRPPLPYPFFIKPVKGRFSAFARRIDNQQDWHSLSQSVCVPPAGFRRGYDALAARCGPLQGGADDLIAESLLRGEQVTLDGYVQNGEVVVLGIVDSIMYPGTISFARFQYPSRLPAAIQERMADCTRRYIGSLDLDNAMFNIEFFYDAEQDRIAVIELNPRPASGFADLYEKVDGVNLFTLAMRIATGQPAAAPYRAGRFTHAAAFIGRVFRDYFVRAVPGPAECAAVTQRFPEARLEICAKPGRYLSDKMQDCASFRYALVHLGGDSERDLIAKHETVQAMLPFDFVDKEAL